MKNYSYVLAGAFSLLLFSGCSQDESVEGADAGKENMKTLVFSASSQAKTRNSLEPNGSVLWGVGDSIWVNGKASKALKDTDLREGGARADFTVEAETLPAAPYVGLYTTDTGVSYNSGSRTYSLTFSDRQEGYDAAKGTFDSFGVNPMVTMPSADYNLSFKNVCGIVRLKVKYPASAIKTVRFESAGEKVSGKAKIKVPANASSGVPTLTLDDVQSDFAGEVTVKSVVLKTQAPLNDYTQIDIVLPAGTYAAGWKIAIADGGGSIVQRSAAATASLTVERSSIKDLGIFDFTPGVFEYTEEMGVTVNGVTWAPSDLYGSGTTLFFACHPAWNSDGYQPNDKWVPEGEGDMDSRTEDICRHVKPVGYWKMATESDWRKLYNANKVTRTMVPYYRGAKRNGYYLGVDKSNSSAAIDPASLETNTLLAAKLVFFEGSNARYWVGTRVDKYTFLIKATQPSTGGFFSGVQDVAMRNKYRVRCVKK